MSSIDGLRDEDHAHLSDSARERLRAEREVGAKRIQAAKEREDAARARQAEQREDDEESEEGDAGIDTNLNADSVIGQRQGAQEQRAEDAELIRERNARIAAEKELADAREQLAGRATPHPAAAAAAEDLVRQRTEQAKEIGLQPGTPFVGHPETSEVQAEAAHAAAAKEISDRGEARNYDASGGYPGVTGEVEVETDEWGEPVVPEDEAAQGNGQVPYSAEEQRATELVHNEAEPRRNRRQRAAGAGKNDTRAVGDGPKSE